MRLGTRKRPKVGDPRAGVKCLRTHPEKRGVQCMQVGTHVSHMAIDPGRGIIVWAAS